MGTDLMNSGGNTELSPVFPGQVPSYLGLTRGERPLAAPGLNATGDPEEEEEEEEEEKEKKGEEEEDEEENDGEEDEVPWQVTVPDSRRMKAEG
jgi:hypothetical protein